MENQNDLQIDIKPAIEKISSVSFIKIFIITLYAFIAFLILSSITGYITYSIIQKNAKEAVQNEIDQQKRLLELYEEAGKAK